MTMNKHQKCMKKAEDFAEENLFEIAGEILNWNGTGILVDGKLRELAAILNETLSSHDSLQVAESISKNLIVEQFWESRPA